MLRQLVTPAQLEGEALSLEGASARHLLTVLRVRRGDVVEFFDGQGHTRRATVAETGRGHLMLALAEPVRAHPRAGCCMTLFACISKGTRMEWTVEKATELGVARIVPVISQRTVARPAGSERWQRIAGEAARQCGACWLPEILPPTSFEKALALATGQPLYVASLAPAARPLRDVLAERPAPPAAGWLVGPEGDLTPAELEALHSFGAESVSLGPLVLRSETACLYGLAVFACAWY